MKPLDAGQPNTEDGTSESPSRNLDEIWASIGPGRDTDLESNGPPTIRLTESTPSIHPSLDKDLSPVNHPSDEPVSNPADHANQADLNPTTEIETGIREELRVGVRMIKALDAQLKRAETLIRLQEESSRKAENTARVLTDHARMFEDGTVSNPLPDSSAVDIATDAAIERISNVTDEAVRGLQDRLERFIALDTRMDEFDAALSTIERRVDRVGERAKSMPTSTSKPANLQSGSLSVGGMTLDFKPAVSDPPRTSESSSERSTLSIHLMIERAEEIRRELRIDLEAICSASATLAEIVDQANQTESILRGTLDSAGGDSKTDIDGGWGVASILRRLADEIDVESTTVDRGKTANPVRKVNGIDVARPVILELGADGTPTSEPRPSPTEESVGR